jgi:type I restriction enzyme M protein
MLNSQQVSKPVLGDDYLTDLNAGMVNITLETSREYCRVWLGYYFSLCNRMMKFVESQDITKSEILELSNEDSETVKFIQSSVGYFIKPEHLFLSWIEKGVDFDYSDVNIAIRAFERINQNCMKGEFTESFYAFEKHINILAKKVSGDRTREIFRLLHPVMIELG